LACTSIISSSVLVRCLLFPTLQLFRCFPAGQARHRVCEWRKGEHIMGRLPCQDIPLDFSRRAQVVASKGCCENIAASGVRLIPGATMSYMIHA
jgi:hypothetical protein